MLEQSTYLYFIVDVSGSMRGARIDAVNDSIRTILHNLHSTNNGSYFVEIMEFSSAARWITVQPESVCSYQYKDIENVSGGTNYGKAFSALAERFIGNSSSNHTFFIIFITDGEPSDLGLYKEDLDILKKNPLFKQSTRLCFAIGDGASSSTCIRVLGEITEVPSNVYSIANSGELLKEINSVVLPLLNVSNSVSQHDDSTNSRPIIQEDAPHRVPQSYRQDVSNKCSESPNATSSNNDWIYDLSL